jgi:peptide/nickel transport system substrate-binding protein
MTQKNILILLGVILLLVAVSTASAKDELKIATWDDVNTFDPGWMTSTERELPIMTCLYNGLVKYKEGSWEVVPDLATSWKISSDSKEITFYLRKGVKFHKGFGEMTGEDVKFSFERITDPVLKSPEKDNWDRLDHVEVLDKYTVKLVLKSPMANLFTSALPVNTGMIVSQKAVEKFGQKEFGFNPIGTGPYQLEKWEPKKSVKLVRNEDYWDEKPKIKIVTFVPIVEDSTCEAALKSGEIDIGRAASINIDAFKRDSKFKVYTKPGLKYWWIGFTVNKPPFDNPKLREACRYAIDVNRILKGAFFGVADRANTILPPGMPGHWVEAPEYKVDIEKAKQLLKEGGKPDGFKVRCFGWSDEQVKIIAEMVKADLAKIGVDVDIIVKETGAFNEATKAGEPEMYVSFFATTIDPGYAMVWFTSDNSWNISHWKDPNYDKLIKQGETEMDPKKRADIYLEAQREIDRACWAIWLTHGVIVCVVNANVDIGKLYPNGRLAPWIISFK